MKAEITVLAGDGIGPEITEHALNTVSYTHLTLPTIVSV